MNISKLSLAFLILLLFTSTYISAQRNCATDERFATYLSNPDNLAKWEKRMKDINNTPVRDKSMACASTINIPVAIHYADLPVGYSQACLENLAIATVNGLNEDFNALNSDISNWNTTGSHVAQFGFAQPGEACIHFCIASQNHPSGFGLSNGTLAITYNQIPNFSPSNVPFSAPWSGYFNIFVQELTGGTLGYVNTIPGIGNGDGMVIDHAYFTARGITLPACGAVGTATSFHLGRTATHEAGHWFGLEHIFTNTNCTQMADGISDTPGQNAPNYSCPANGVGTCGSPDMHMSYMDYADDACMWMFSPGQAARINQVASSSAFTNVRNKYNTACVATCNDGILNQGELNIDCGGPCVPCCSTDLTNTNGLMTTETGVNDYESTTYINTTAPTTLQNGSRVDYDATTYVQLNPGFTVNSGAIFNAFIDGCGNNGTTGVNLNGDNPNSLQTQDPDAILDEKTKIELQKIRGLGKNYIQILKDQAIKQIEGMK